MNTDTDGATNELFWKFCIPTVPSALVNGVRLVIGLLALLIIVTVRSPVAASSNCDDQSPANVHVDYDSDSYTWKPVSDEDEVCAWSRQTDPDISKIKEVAAVAVIDARAADIAKLMADESQYPFIFPNVEYARQVRNHSGGSTWVFVQLKIRGPPRDRYHTIEVRHEKMADDVTDFTWTLVDPTVANRHFRYLDSAPVPRGVATRICQGRLYLKPISDGEQTEVLYYAHTDPGMRRFKKIANMEVNRKVEKEVTQIIRNIRSALEPRPPAVK